MCGFVGFLGGFISDGALGKESLLRRMADSITHRGPDHGGYWCDVDQNIGLGHRRLSVIDLSPARTPTYAVSLQPICNGLQR